MNNSRLHLEVAGTGSYLPEGVIRNEDFLKRDLTHYDEEGNPYTTIRETSKQITDVTGILERRKALPGEWPSDLGYRAAVKAIEKAGINADSLTGIITATVTEDKNFPCASVKIQKMLGAKGYCFAYDVANACAGFPEALAQANSRVTDRPGNYLVVAAECLLNMVDKNELNSSLFGEGAGAAVLTPTESERGIVGSYSCSNPFEDNDRLIFRDDDRILRMPFGKKVFRQATKEMKKSVDTLKENLGWDCADVIIPHQANSRIINWIEERLPEETKVFKNIERYGNMSAATCAVGLDEALEEEMIKQGNRVIITSFGSGLVTSAVAIQF